MSADTSPAAVQQAVSRDPANGQLIAQYPFTSEAELEQILASLQCGFHAWSGTAVEERARIVKAMAGVLRRRREELAALATAEMGKPLKDMLAEVEKCAFLCEWYAEHGPCWLADEPTEIPDGKAYVSYLPLGAVLGVMPWNFPYWQPLRAAVPILLGGNGFLLKPAENVVGTGHLLQAAWQEAGVPAGAFITANLSREHSAKALADPRIAAVTVTGSVAAGQAIAAQAGAALKKVVLELGGADPFIVLADADLPAAIEAAVASRFQNAGQVCIAGKRLIVEAPIIEAFTQGFVARVQELKVGDGREATTTMGPMARLDLLQQLDCQVQDSIAAGAELLTGGQRLPGAGYFYAPTVLRGVKSGMPAFDAELFGPVAAIVEARDVEHALELANDSEYGLSSNVWTSDLDRARALARRLVTGGVFINGFSASDPRVPIGGVKKSGFGRELSHFGLREFVNAQTVWFDRR